MSRRFAQAIFAIITEIGELRGFTAEQIISTDRSQPLFHARHEAMALAKERTGATLAEIGAAFQRDHTTVSYGIGQHQRRMSTVQGATK